MLSRRALLAGLTLVPTLRWSVVVASALPEDLPPIVGDGSIALACVNLTTLDLAKLALRVAEPATDSSMAITLQAASARLAALKQAGATRLFVLGDMADFLGAPVLAVPLAAGADSQRIQAELIQGLPGLVIDRAAGEVIRGLVVVGQPAALTRIRELQPTARPDLQSALSLGDPADPIRVAISPGVGLRRAVEESLPTLPDIVGGGSITTLTQGMSWMSLVFSAASGRARGTIQTTSPVAAEAVRQLTSVGILALSRGAGTEDQAVPALGTSLGQVRFEVKQDRVVADLEPATVTALVSIPIRQAQEAINESRTIDNLKTLGLAMHNYLSAHATFPPAFRTDPAGRPSLSWRVLILPYLDEQPLYEAFHLDEPWDSPHNKPLIARMPAVYATPSGSKSLPAGGKTTYLTPRGAKTMFPGATPVSLAQVIDGTSNTIMVIEVDDSAATTWTKPDDWEVDAPGFRFEARRRRATFGDGSVVRLKREIRPEILLALMTCNGGEVLGREDF